MILPLLLSAGVLAPLHVHAEWTIAAYLGASVTAAADLTLDRPAAGGPVLMRDVTFDSRSFESPPYYGYRVRWMPFTGAQLALEAELVHLKVYARAAALAPPVERFSISHGLNLLLGNLVWRTPLHRRVWLAARGGAGVAVPHGESRVAGIDEEQYEISSLALQAAAGPEFAVSRHVRALVEYKLTTTAPSVAVPGGRISGRYRSQHVAAGLGVAW